ncbi:MAG: DUF393 domain-containing protein [Gemmatimonadetes bacterium]|nr:DUF393 domain-containing protein [Gemmatimonadota bacterium]
MTGYTLYYDGGCRLCVNSVKWVRRLAWLGSIRYVDVSDRAAFERMVTGLTWGAVTKAMHVRASDGALHTGYYGFRALLRTMPLLWPLRPLLALAVVAAVGERVYAWVAHQRYRWNRCESACAVHQPPA